MLEHLSGNRLQSEAVLNEIARLSLSRGLNLAKPLPPIVADSWKRCFSDHHLDPDGISRPAVLTHAELRELSEKYVDFLAVAAPEVESLFLRLVDSEYLVSLASPQGAMMLFRCDYHFLTDMSNFGVLPGSVWTEERQGTNGVGTCLTTGKSVIIAGNQHYGSGAQSLTCLTAPILGKSGAVESVLNVTTPRAGDERTNRVVLDIVERSARRIENRYFGRVFQKNTILRLAIDRDHVDLSEEGQLAVDDNGMVVAGTSYVGKLTGHFANDLIGRHIEDVFDMNMRLSEMAPGKPVPFTMNGKTVHAALTTATDRFRNYRTPGLATIHSTSLQQLVPVVHQINLPLPDSRLDPMTSMLLDRASKLLKAGLPIVIEGESGTGKTVFAHIAARRSFGENSLTVEVDCAARSGASITAAVAELSSPDISGTLIIDRLSELDESGQAVLLAALENNPFLFTGRVGVIAVTTANLEHMVRDGTMRADLFHRLNGGAIELPSLRTNPDLHSAIRDLLQLELAYLGKTDLKLCEQARLVLENYHWSGNTRELRHALRHAVALADGKTIELDHLPAEIVAEIAGKDLTARSQAEASRIEAALRFNGGNVSTTARHLGVSRATLYRKIQIQKLRGEAQFALT
jgi:sigma-54 dependent transcriptional regulator, acetoin dehydrogenase operon transcriptional activator AcoR